MTQPICVEFKGPFAWFHTDSVRSIFEAPGGKKSGVYLWTVTSPEGELVYYVGETGRSFARRMEEHLRDQLSGMYHIHDPKTLSDGVKKMLWPGTYDKKHPAKVVDFVAHLQELREPLTGFVKLMRFYLAALETELRIRRRIESALADHFYKQDGIVGTFQEEGIHYYRRHEQESTFLVTVTASIKIRGLSENLMV